MNKGGLFLSIGDSITWTMHDSTGNGEQIWTQMLYRWIQNNYGNIQFINKGFGGAQSGTIIQNKFWLVRFSPDLLLISTGVNDASNNIPTSTYQSNLTTVINWFRKRNPNVIIILCSPSTSANDLTWPVGNYRTVVQNLSTSLGTGIIHLENAWSQAQNSIYTAADGLHPNVLGNQMLFNVAQPVIQTYAASWLERIGN